MTSPGQCSEALLETIPLVMRTIRSEMRRQRRTDLTVPQFRSLAFLQHYPGATLSQVAEHVGLRLPSMSTLIEGLVRRKLVGRQVSPQDRRCVTLALTADGSATLKTTEAAAQTSLAGTLKALAEKDQALVVEAMIALKSVFSGEKKDGKPA